MLSEVSGEMLCYRKERRGDVNVQTCSVCALTGLRVRLVRLYARAPECLAAVRLSTPLICADSFVIGALDEVCVSVCRVWGGVWG